MQRISQKTAKRPSTRNSRKPKRISAGSIYTQFLNELLDGTIEPGQRLGEPTLAARWKVSRPSVRDALIRLECEGVVERRPQSGTYVSRIEGEQIEELYDLRATIESFVMRKLVLVVTDEELDELELLAVRADDADLQRMSAQEVIERESLFHLRLCEMARLPHTMRLLNVPHLLLSTFRLALMHQATKPDVPHHHHDLVTALRNRDAKRCEEIVMRIAATAKEELLEPIAKSEIKPPSSKRASSA